MIAYKNLLIQSIDKDLDGIVEINGKIVKVPFSVVGDIVTVTNLNTKNKIPIANMQLVKPSRYRKEPICKYYSKCGGCKGQHFQVADYLQYKVQNIKNTFNAYKLPFPEHIKMEVFHHLESPKGRRRVILGVAKDKIGFKGYHSNLVVPIDVCSIATDSINIVINLLQKYLSKQNTVLQLTEIIISDIQGEINLHLKASTRAELPQLQVLQPLFNSSVIQQIFWEYKKELTPIIIKKDLNLVYGNNSVPFICGGFLQAEEVGEKALINLVLQALKDSAKVLDLFCGFGSYALSLAPEKQKVHGVDFNPNALKNLGQQLGITTEVRNLFSNPYNENELQKFSAVVINPPRIGAKAQVLEIAFANHDSIKDIVMIYCDVSSAVRDLRILMQSAKNFQIIRIAMIEQFIFSKHVELFIHLRRG